MDSTNAPESAAFPRQFARTRRFSLGVPRNFTVSPDGQRVLFTRTGGGRDPIGRLWLLADGAERLLADPTALVGGGGEVPEEERLRRERARERSAGVVAYATDRAARLAVFALGGALWAVRTDGGEPFPVPAAGPVVDPRPSPDGRHIAYVTGRSLHVVEVPDEGAGAAGRDRQLAAAEGPEISYGLAEYTAAESMGRLRGHWWSPDGTRLLVARVDTTRVHRRWISDPAHPDRPPRAIRYPLAGTDNADVRLWVYGLDGSRTEVAWDRTAYEYLATVGWDAHGPLIGVQSRDQRSLRTLAVDPDTGATALLDERTDPAWVELVPGTPARTASGALVLTHDVAGTRHLAVGGKVVTPAGLQVRGVLGTEDERVYFTASDDPVETHVWCHDPEAGAPVRLSEGPGTHGAVVGGGTAVFHGLTPEGPYAEVRRTGGTEAPSSPSVTTIASLAEAPVITPRPRHLVLGERQLRATLYLPSWYEPGTGPLPVLLDPYAGPGMQLAVAARGWTACVSQWFAEQGFAVLVADGRGTPGRGPEWEKAVHGDQLTPALEDQVDALHAAAEQVPDLDLDRVAIRGWSFSGFLAAAAVLLRPEVFHAAVAGAATTDQRLYDTYWKERFLGHPAEQPQNYERSSLTGRGHLLRRPLLLIHGLADDNVTVANMLRFSAELLAAGRPHTVLPLPGATHAPADDRVNENLLLFQRDFLLDALGLGRNPAGTRPPGPAPVHGA
ncbi:S9 family peptidase [Streptomyces purpurogeneiscleroticus]|uniref:S9 family peptidase n=1 Tax=Streptomyces purpurogeneiscleroticus TaxID=68259 RepID=UPI001CBAA9AE|nr:prolyl oligopeptidase family serine peptidase [Streptomyces purpurogeneiscleroticus]MBZ4017529.1 S9 family peptidase [Streptomyces purpurogeneiscleroticus]